MSKFKIQNSKLQYKTKIFIIFLLFVASLFLFTNINFTKADDTSWPGNTSNAPGSVSVGAPGSVSVGAPGSVSVGPPGSTGNASPWSISNFVTSSSFEDLVNRIAGWIFTIAIPLAVIMIIWSGVLFMTAAGDENKVTTARKALTWSIVGLAIAIIGKGFTTLISDILSPVGGGANLTSQGVVTVLNNLANWIFSLAIVLAVIMIIWAGVLFMTASGSEEKITKARKALIWSLVGVAIAIVSKGIVYLVQSFITTGK